MVAQTAQYHVPTHNRGRSQDTQTISLPARDTVGSWINRELTADTAGEHVPDPDYFRLGTQETPTDERGHVYLRKRGFISGRFEEHVQITGTSINVWGSANNAFFTFDIHVILYGMSNEKKASFSYEHSISIDRDQMWTRSFVADITIPLMPVDDGDYFRIEAHATCSLDNATLRFLLNEEDHTEHFDERLRFNFYETPFVEQVITEGSRLQTGRNGNSYMTLSEIGLMQKEWRDLTVEEKDEEVLRATMILDDLPWLGEPLHEDQRLAWPRKEFKYMEPRFGKDITVAENSLPTRLKLVIEAIILYNLKNPDSSDIGSVSIGDISISKQSRNRDHWEYMVYPLLKPRYWWVAW